MSISKEAIEAGAIAMFYQQVGLNPPYPLWDGADADEKDNCLNDAELALTAAAPILQAQAVRAELMQLASMLEPFSGIGLANGATRNDVANWVRARAVQLEGKTK